MITPLLVHVTEWQGAVFWFAQARSRVVYLLEKCAFSRVVYLFRMLDASV